MSPQLTPTTAPGSCQSCLPVTEQPSRREQLGELMSEIIGVSAALREISQSSAQSSHTSDNESPPSSETQVIPNRFRVRQSPAPPWLQSAPRRGPVGGPDGRRGDVVQRPFAVARVEATTKRVPEPAKWVWPAWGIRLCHAWIIAVRSVHVVPADTHRRPRQQPLLVTLSSSTLKSRRPHVTGLMKA
jgi:hypothetical protein